MANIGSISISPSALTVSSASTAITSAFTITSTLINRNLSTQITKDVGWFQPNQSVINTDGSGSIVLIVNENKTTSQRSGTFYLTGVDIYGHIITSNTITVTQGAGSGEVDPDPYEFELTYSSKTVSPSISTFEVGWTKSDNVDHIALGTITDANSIIEGTRLNQNSLYVEIKKNTTTSQRIASIVLNAVNANNVVVLTRTLSIVQLSKNDTEGIIQFSPTEIIVDSKRNEGRITTTFASGWRFIGAEFIGAYEEFHSDAWLEPAYYAAGKITDWVIYPNNERDYSGTTRTCTYSVSAENISDSSIVVTNTLQITQNKEADTLYFPIWKDTDIEIESEQSFVYYRVMIDGKIAYSGKAYKIDGSIKVRLNGILKDYLSGSIDFETRGVQDNEDNYITAYLMVSEDNWASSVINRIIRVWNDWSYKEDDILVHFASDELDARQYFVTSIIVPNDEERGRLQCVENLRKFVSYNVKDDSNNLVAKVNSIVEVGHLDFTVSANTVSYKVFPITCRHKFALYFRNIWGQYDWILMNSASKKTDSIETLEYQRIINNYTLDRSIVQYEKKITEKYALKTDRISRSKAELYAMAFRSVDCYLHNLETDEIYPVNVTDTSVDCQIGKGKPVQFTINVQIAQDRFSR